VLPPVVPHNDAGSDRALSSTVLLASPRPAGRLVGGGVLPRAAPDLFLTALLPVLAAPASEPARGALARRSLAAARFAVLERARYVGADPHLDATATDAAGLSAGGGGGGGAPPLGSEGGAALAPAAPSPATPTTPLPPPLPLRAAPPRLVPPLVVVPLAL
jgi:hypothetical protein